MGVALEARGGGHAKAKRGKTSSDIFDAWPRPGEGEYIRDKYATVNRIERVPKGDVATPLSRGDV
jgi:hypothetical protein